MSTGKPYDAIVLGVGGMGAAACYHLARRGRRVLGLERFDVPHAMGSSHGTTRIIRLAYYEHPSYVPLLRRAYELWRELEVGFGEQLLHLTASVEEVIRSYITREIMQGDDRALALDYPLIDEHVLDSMDIQRLVAFLETQFGVRVTDDFLLPDNFASVRAIARMVGEFGATT